MSTYFSGTIRRHKMEIYQTQTPLIDERQFLFLSEGSSTSKWYRWWLASNYFCLPSEIAYRASLGWVSCQKIIIYSIKLKNGLKMGILLKFSALFYLHLSFQSVLYLFWYNFLIWLCSEDWFDFDIVQFPLLSFKCFG